MSDKTTLPEPVARSEVNFLPSQPLYSEAQMRALADRVAECEAALDSEPCGSGFWRFWCEKATKLSLRNVDLERRATTAEAKAEAYAVQMGEVDAENARLRTALATAHNDALEKAAKLIKEHTITYISGGVRGLEPRGDDDQQGLEYATAILALKKETPNADK